LSELSFDLWSKLSKQRGMVLFDGFAPHHSRAHLCSC
jgi:hypothetical protein